MVLLLRLFFHFANSLATIFIFAIFSNFTFENGFATISNFTFAMITKSDFIAIDNEKWFPSHIEKIVPRSLVHQIDNC